MEAGDADHWAWGSMCGIRGVFHSQHLYVLGPIGFLVDGLPAALPCRRLFEVHIVAIDWGAAIKHRGLPQQHHRGVPHLQHVEADRSALQDEKDGLYRENLTSLT